MCASCSSTSSARSGWTYDVFLSFRGEDTRKNFTDHLYAAFVQAGIYTFRDDEMLPRGEEISPQLLKAIKESKISVVVFSKGYASSTWCLNELEKIMECKSTVDQIVLPVFYNMDPSYVRNQKGSFEEAFEKHEKCFKEEMEKANKWRKALKEAADLSGFHLNNMANGHEAKFIQKIVEHVRNKLGPKLFDAAKHLVGVDYVADRIIDLLSIDTGDVCIVGIYGMPGIGKTTLAKAVFNGLCNGFDGCSFLFDVREKSKKDGLVQLQEQLLCDILKSNGFKIWDKYRGTTLIRERLSRKRVLLVVDDVDQLKQLEDLLGERSWFGPGSRIIITTRDERLLTQFKVDEKYRVKGLDRDASLQLFCWHAFKNSHLIQDFEELSHRAVGYCGGLPLALKVLGSSLLNSSKRDWECILDKLQKVPNKEIEGTLRIVFDSLDDSKLKEAFLDIACFFVGWDKEYVAEILDGRGFYAHTAIKTLVERSLITINYPNELGMHDLIRDMGRAIVHEISPDNSGKCSRIWFHEDVMNVLNKHSGTELVQGLRLDVPASEAVNVRTKSFTKMTQLKLLQINGVHLTGSYKHLSKELIWLCWHECPYNSLPSNLELSNLVVLDMQYSNMKELWRGTKLLNKLKILDLSYSKHLYKAPNLCSSSLEKLLLESCSSLIEMDQSIGRLERLVFLNLKGCCKLKILPESISNLKSLETLNIADCSNLEKLPKYLGDMKSLTELIADGTALRQLPSSIGHLKNLRKLSLAGSNYEQNLRSTSWLSVISSWLSPRSSNSKTLPPASLSGLGSLRELNLSYCGLSEGIIFSTCLGGLSSVVELDLSGNKFFNMPSGIGCLPKLQRLQVHNCANLVSISELPSSLESLNAHNCTSIKSLLVPSNTNLQLYARGCQNLIEIQGMERAGNSWFLTLNECNNLSNDFKESILQEMGKGEDLSFLIAGGEIPEWFSHHGEGSSLSFKIPNAVSDATLESLLFWVIVRKGRIHRLVCCDAWIRNKSNGKTLLKKAVAFEFESNDNERSWVSHMTTTRLLAPFAMQSGDEWELRFSSLHGEIKKCGIHMIVKTPDVESSIDAEWLKSCLMSELLQSQICKVSTDQIVMDPDPISQRNFVHRNKEEAFTRFTGGRHLRL